MLGRSRQEGIDKWKAAILSSTLSLLLAGAVVGLMAGARIGGHAPIVPASICLTLAAVCVARARARGFQQQPAAAEAATT